MKRIASTLGCGLMGLMASAPQAISSTNVTAPSSPTPAQRLHLAQSATAEYETYYNRRFDFAVQYPSDRLHPQPPPTNRDGRVFRSPRGHIEMRVYGYHQTRQTLEAVYRQRLQDLRQSGADVTYDYLGDDEFVLSGYDANNQVFYRRVLLRHNDFLVLDITYDRALQPEFDAVVAEIADSFRASDRAARESSAPG